MMMIDKKGRKRERERKERADWRRKREIGREEMRGRAREGWAGESEK